MKLQGKVLVLVSLMLLLMDLSLSMNLENRLVQPLRELFEKLIVRQGISPCLFF